MLCDVTGRAVMGHVVCCHGPCVLSWVLLCAVTGRVVCCHRSCYVLSWVMLCAAMGHMLCAVTGHDVHCHRSCCVLLGGREEVGGVEADVSGHAQGHCPASHGGEESQGRPRTEEPYHRCRVEGARNTRGTNGITEGIIIIQHFHYCSNTTSNMVHPQLF